MAIFNKTKVNTSSDTKSLKDVFKTIKAFLSEGEDVPNLYEGNDLATDNNEYKDITSVNVEAFEKELENYFESFVGTPNKEKKKKLRKALFSNKVIYTININSQDGMKMAKLKINYKFKNHQLTDINLRLELNKKDNSRIKTSKVKTPKKSKAPKTNQEILNDFVNKNGRERTDR